MGSEELDSPGGQRLAWVLLWDRILDLWAQESYSSVPLANSYWYLLCTRPVLFARDVTANMRDMVSTLMEVNILVGKSNRE